MDRLQLAALNWTQDDYEAVSTIRDQVGELLGEPVSAEELFAALWTLEGRGLVTAQRFDQTCKAWVQVPPTETDPEDVWFLATVEGRRVVDREWDGVFGDA